MFSRISAVTERSVKPMSTMLCGRCDWPCSRPMSIFKWQLISCPEEKNVRRSAAASLEWAAQQNGNVQIFDTAGRQEVDIALVEEIKALKEFLEPQEVLLVADAATGQQAVSVAKHFHEALGLTGIVL